MVFNPTRLSKFFQVRRWEFLYWLAFTFFVISLLTIFFPYPYYAEHFEFGNKLPATYDSSADYISEILSVYVNGHSMDYLHPGLPIKYFSAFLMKLMGNLNTVEAINFVSRTYLLFFNLISIYVGSRLILKQALSSSFLLLSIVIIFPSGFLFIDDVSPNGILFGLSVLLISLGQEIGLKYTLPKLILYSLILGFSISMKYSMAILTLPLLIALPFINKGNNQKNIKFFVTVFYLSIFTTFSLILFFTFPIFPFLPFFFTQLGPLISFLDIFLSTEPYLIIVSFSLVIIVFFYLGRIFLRTKFTYIQIYRFVTGILLVGLCIFTFYNLFIWDSWASIATSLRNYLPLLGLVALFLPLETKSSSYFLTRPYFVTFILFVALIMKVSFNSASQGPAEREDQLMNQFIDENSLRYDYLVLYPISNFTSKDLVLLWGDYRYGDRKKSFLDENEVNPVIFNSRLKKMRVLNSRHFDLPDPSNSFSYDYFNFIINNKFFTQSQKSIASNQLSLLFKKDICDEPFRDYKRGNSALIVFPLSMESFGKGNEPLKPDRALHFVNELEDDFRKRCNLKTKVEKIVNFNQQYYLLSIQ